MNGEDSKSPHLFVDEDWKQRVEAERQREANRAGAAAPESHGASHEMPPASFEMLVTSVSTQALIGLGLLADPQSGRGQLDLPLAKHSIDMLGVIQEKTRGNLTAAEAEWLEETIHQFRLAFVAQSTAAGPPSAPPTSGPQLELP